MKTNRGPFAQDDFLLLASGAGGEFRLLDLAGNGAFKGATVSIFAKTPKGSAGDGFVDLGYLDASGVALGKVKVDGDLGQIDAGDSSAAKPALKSLKTNSLGARALSTQGMGGSLQSDLAGDLGALVVKSNIQGATLAVLGRLGDVKVGGDLADSSILARGTLLPAGRSDAIAIRSVSVGGDVAGSQILAGYDAARMAVNPDVQVGAVSIEGNWRASSLAVGIADSTADGFGRNDTLIPGGNPGIVAQIAAIRIRGTATGSADSTTDHFGIVAELIRNATIGGVAVPLSAAKDDLSVDPANKDFRLVEI